MHNPTITESRPLNVDCLPVHITQLTKDGLLPDKLEKSPPLKKDAKLHVCRHLPPGNLTEQTLLSIWINTHQAMFIATGISAYCVMQIIQHIKQEEDLETIRHFIQLAVDCRLSSAAYTSLPHLTKELYEAYIRESMMLVHPGFSGVSNQEAITMEHALRELKKAQTELGYSNRNLANTLTADLEKLYGADRTWWKFHGKAMAKLVENPVSLARMDFKHQLNQGSGDNSFDDYRDRILRQEGAVTDYDSYFAVRRSDQLSVQDYKRTLISALERSSHYVDPNGELADYREAGEIALHAVMDYETQQLQRQSTRTPELEAG
jgi:hypothetical protein